MEAPKCKLCGQRHYGMCAVPASHSPSTGEAQDAPPTAKPKFDRNAYQRELMRKRRAADRAKREQQ